MFLQSANLGSGPAFRLIPRLDIKAPNLVKGVHLEGLRVVGDPAEFAARYCADGADELLYVDIVASLYERNSIVELVQRTAREIFIPLTVAGGIRCLEDIQRLLRAGADKVAINTAAIRNPWLIADAARRFGSQCIVLSVEAKRTTKGSWEAYTDNGREKTGLDAVEWIRRAVDLGAGEVLLTSVDQEGTRRGFDRDLIAAVASLVPVPVIASGGAGMPTHLLEAAHVGADAVAIADMLHSRRFAVPALKTQLLEGGLRIAS